MAQLGFNRLGRLGQVVFRNCTVRQIALPLINTTQMRTRINSTNPVALVKEGLLLSRDETCFLAYHPDKEHPYSDTRPVPTQEKEESILKVDSRNMITKSPNLEQLQVLTYTPRRYWIQWPGKVKRKKMMDYYNDNVDRPGLTS